MAVNSSKSGGFTLLEAMVVVAILGILAAIATPNLRQFLLNVNARGAAQDLISDLTLARSEAIKRNTAIEIVAVDSTDWAKGWKVNVVGGAMLRERAKLSSGISLSPASSGGVQFAANGRLGAATLVTSQSWTVNVAENTALARCVVITPTGTARSKKGAC